MLESKKPSQLIKKLQSNEVELKVNFLDETTHTFSVKVSVAFFFLIQIKRKSIFQAHKRLCKIKIQNNMNFFLNLL